MFEDKKSISDQLRAGEDATVEFKELRLGGRSVISPNAEGFAGDCVAFANSEGGAVFLGVDDAGQAVFDAGAVEAADDGDAGAVFNTVLSRKITSPQSAGRSARTKAMPRFSACRTSMKPARSSSCVSSVGAASVCAPRISASIRWRAGPPPPAKSTMATRPPGLKTL